MEEVNEGAEQAHVENPDLLPGHSPQHLRPRGVRRVNNIPLLIVFGAGSLFLAVMTYTVLGRSAQKEEENGDVRPGESATAVAAKIIHGRPAAEQPRRDAAPAAPQVPVAKAPLPAPRTMERPELTRSPEQEALRQRRLQLAEQAIQSNIWVRLTDTPASAQGTPQSALHSEIERVQQQIRSLQSTPGNDAVLTQAQQQLALLQAQAGGGATSAVFQHDAAHLDRGQTGVISGVQAPRTEYILRTGAVIPATLISGMNSDLPGQIIGQVSQNIYDTPTGRHLLIPQGSRLVGEYSSQVEYGQSRVFAVWQRIVFPDGKALELGAFPAATGAGYAGMRDKVNNHYLRIFGSAIMLSGIVAGIEYTQNQQGSDDDNQQRMGDTMSQALGQTLGQTMVEMIRRNMNIAPTLEIRPGFRLNVMLVKDLEFAGAYRAFDWR